MDLSSADWRRSALEDTLKTGDWRIVVGLVAIPAVIYLLMLIGAKFPKSEQEAAGVSYREMLGEFGAFGALVGFGLIFMQLGEVFGWNEGNSKYIAPVLTGAVDGRLWRLYTEPWPSDHGISDHHHDAIGDNGNWHGLLDQRPDGKTNGSGRTKSGLGSGLYFGDHDGSAILRRSDCPQPVTDRPVDYQFCSGHRWIVCTVQSVETPALGMIFAAATLYGFGKTFFWPTMLGVTAEQCPKGGALTLNAISGIGMIAVGVLGTPFIGYVQAQTASTVLTEKSADGCQRQSFLTKSSWGSIIRPSTRTKKRRSQTRQAWRHCQTQRRAAALKRLGKMVMFPAFMLTCYIILFLYFKSKGGYKAQVLGDH